MGRPRRVDGSTPSLRLSPSVDFLLFFTQSGLEVFPRELAADHLLSRLAGLDQFGEVDSGIHLPSVQHEHQVLARQVAPGPGRVAASSQSPAPRIQGGNPPPKPYQGGAPRASPALL